jgi:hypothetical protein
MNTCTICLEGIDPAVSGYARTHCNHVYHIGCLSTWTLQNPTCPQCRSTLSPKDIPVPRTSPAMTFPDFLRDFIRKARSEEEIYGSGTVYALYAQYVRMYPTQ